MSLPESEAMLVKSEVAFVMQNLVDRAVIERMYESVSKS